MAMRIGAFHLNAFLRLNQEISPFYQTKCIALETQNEFKSAKKCLRIQYKSYLHGRVLILTSFFLTVKIATE